jgi:predicted Zn-dependent protease
MRAMPFGELDRPALARALAQLLDGSDDLADAFLERVEVVELPPAGEPAGARLWREEGLAVRLYRGGRSWLASRDRLDGEAFADALRQVARVAPRTGVAVPPRLAQPWAALPSSADLEGFPRLLDRALREKRVAFSYRLALRRHRRDLQVVTPHLEPAPERETFYSYRVELDGVVVGGLLAELGDASAEALAGRLAETFRARSAAPPEAGAATVLLGPAAAATLLHEAVAHALEADTLASSGGTAQAARGVRLSTAPLDVLDDAGGAPLTVRRRSDDEGTPVLPRWLLRRGVVDQPLADQRWARRIAGLEPGAGRRASRHHLPGPRSTYLRLLPDAGSLPELLARAGEGLYLDEPARGRLDAAGVCTLAFPRGRRIRAGALSDPVGPCTVRGRVADLLGGVAAVGGNAVVAGAGWCAKGGQRLPVWAAAPELLLSGIEVAG